MDKERRWFVGIDWGSEEHVVSLCDDAGKKIVIAHADVGRVTPADKGNPFKV
jgi:hypothetical protein